MASTVLAGDPMCDPDILRTERVLLVENVIFENVMPCIMKFLNFNQIDTIYGQKTQGDRIRKVLEYIERLADASQYEAFNVLMKAIGGTQPELFRSLLGRGPTEIESMYCITNSSQDLKDTIIKKGHCTDSELDETICFKYEHVELSIVDCKISELEPQSQIPQEYSNYLTRLQGTNKNISASDILSSKSKPNEKVLVFGRPGVGKSTTTQWLARQWALGKWATGVTMLFLLQARFLVNVEVPITVLQLLTLYSLYQLEDMADSHVLSSWLRNPASKILVFVDGLDEIPGFASRMVNTRKIGDLTDRSHPIDLVINILRGCLLPHSIVIAVSRPFLGLSNLPIDSKAEVLGLTSGKVAEYVKRRYPEKVNHILSVLERNHVLLSVCGITFYCMMISRLLSEGVVLMGEEVQTYTRLMAFILVQYTSRKISGSIFSLETKPYLSKISKMAFSGIFQSQEDGKLTKLVFDEKELIKFNLGTDILNCLKKTGIVQITETKIGHNKSVIAEFFHLSGQEMLAVLHFLSYYKCSHDIISPLFAGGHFDMALMYTFGLNFDRTSTWIDKLWTAMGSSNPGANMSITIELSLFIDRLWANSKNKIKVCQLIHEAQWVDKAKEMFRNIAPEGRLSIEHITVTAIDILAVDFVCRCAGSLSSIRLKQVNADATFVKVMISSLFEHNLGALQALNLSQNTIGDDGAKAISVALGDTLEVHTCLKTLNLSHNSIGRAGAEAMADMLRNNTSLKTLHISVNNIGDAGAVAIADVLKDNTSLQTLHISQNSIGDAGAVAMAEMLTHNSHLQTLYIRYNSIGSVGAEAMADMLKHNSSLQTLNVSGNSIGAAGAEVMADVLQSNTSLQILNIDYNTIRDSGAIAMASALYKNTSLTELSVTSNSIGPAGKKALADVGQHRPTLTVKV